MVRSTLPVESKMRISPVRSRVASPLPTHVMVGQRKQLLERPLVSSAPVTEQLRDLLSRG
jgi:hypothetical protein